jgi:hypothetical protein
MSYGARWTSQLPRRLDGFSAGATVGIVGEPPAHRRARHAQGRASQKPRPYLHPTGTEYFVIPGGPIPRDVGDELVTMPDIRPVDSGLFPDSDGQTWELIR